MVDAQNFLEIDGDFRALGPLDLAAIYKTLESATTAQNLVKLSEVQLHAPIPNPSKILCIGLNYRDHCQESGQPIPDHPVLFAKFNNTLVGSEGNIQLNGSSRQVDYEAELAFVIGKKAYRVAESVAMEYVAGYITANDVSGRDLQFSDNQWVRGKSQDTFCPMGPWLVTADEVPNPHNLRISCRVNGTTLQDSNTNQLIFNVPTLLSFLSQGITLEPGDVVLTGTPPGVGFARKPPIFLKAGDVVEVEIEKVGLLKSHVMEQIG